MTEEDLKMYGEPPRPKLRVVGESRVVLEKSIKRPLLCWLGWHGWVIDEVFVGMVGFWTIVRCRRCFAKKTFYEILP